MDTIKDIKQDLINEIMKIEDRDALNAVHKTIEQSKKVIKDRKIDDAIIDIKKGWTLNQIVSDQDIDQITYPEITEIVEHMSWEVSLEELLESID